MAVSIYVVCAMAGCFKRESGVNPGIWESLIIPPDGFYHVYQFDHIGGYGFGQFTNVPFGNVVSWRCRDYYEWCVSHNHDPADGNAELEYICNVERVWMGPDNDHPSILGYTDIDQFLLSTSQNLDALTTDWLSQWEGVPGDNLQERLDAAHRFFNYVRQHKDDDPSTYTWVSGNFYTSDAQMLNNVMCMYFYFQGYDPGGDPTPTPTPGKTTKMPLWMYMKRLPF